MDLLYQIKDDIQKYAETISKVIDLQVEVMSKNFIRFKWLSEDAEIALNMSSMLTAWRLGAQQQTCLLYTSRCV